MAQQKPQAKEPTFISLLLITGIAWWGVLTLGSPVLYGEIQFLPALSWLMAGLGSIRVVIGFFELLAGLARWLMHITPTGKGGTASFARFRDYRWELSSKKTGPFWGMSDG